MATKPTQPGKIWHVWQNTKLAAKAVFNKKERPKMKNAALRGAFGTAGIATAWFTASLVFPIGLIGIAVGGVMAFAGFRNAYSHLDAVKQSRFGQDYLRERMTAWKARQQKAPVAARIKHGAKVVAKKTGIVAGVTALVAGVAGAASSALTWTGVVDASSVIGKVATTMSEFAISYGASASSAAIIVTAAASVAAVTGGVVALRNKRGLQALNGSAPAKQGKKSPASTAGNDNSNLPDWLKKAQKFTDEYNGSAEKSKPQAKTEAPSRKLKP